MVILFTIAAVVVTFLGGLFALRFKDKLHLTLAFSAGTVLAVALFDLIPEALELAEPLGASTVTLVVGVGFILYLILNDTLSLHAHGHDACENTHHQGAIGAGSLSIHSAMDGIAIGLAFQASDAIGLTVAIAVLAHKFSDGVNTVGLILRSDGTRRNAFSWLILAAAAPVAGALSTLFFTITPQALGLTLALFAGFFLYIGASDLIPESHHDHPTHMTTIMIVLGLVTMYVITIVAGV